jgi:hypothetical protein
MFSVGYVVDAVKPVRNIYIRIVTLHPYNTNNLMREPLGDCAIAIP